MQEISQTYYRDHFWQVVDCVVQRHGFLLAKNEIAYIDTLRNLSLDAVSLYIRMVNRKGPYFRVNKLEYADITCLKTAITELQKHSLIFDYRLGNQIDTTLLNCFNHKELYSFLKGYSFKRFAKKAEFCEWISSWDEAHNWLQHVLKYEPVIHLSNQDLWPFLKFLFFGELTDNLSGFVVRELGHVVNVDLSNAELQPLFCARNEAENAYNLANIYQQFRLLRDDSEPADIYQWWLSLAIERQNLSGIALQFFDRLVSRLGRLLERKGEAELAMQLYQTSPVAPSRERLARLYLKFAEGEKAKLLLNEMLDSDNAEEAYIARQLLARIWKTRKRSDARELQNQGVMLELDYLTGHAEIAVIEYYQTQNWQGIHCENWLWNNLFGLFFWDIIYDVSYGSFNQPLQLAPADLYKMEFYQKREAAFDERLDLINNVDESLAFMQQVYAANNGTTNPFVNWHESILSLIEILLKRVSANSLKSILKHMAMDVKLRRRGFPDLFIWNDDNYRFIEVKAAGDQISPQQFNWLKFFAEAGVNCSVQRVCKTRPAMAA